MAGKDRDQRTRPARPASATEATAISGDDGETASLAHDRTRPGLGELLPAESGRLPSLFAGSHIDRFAVIERIGEGGMGIVLSAHDPTLDRRVAIKLLRSGSSSAAGRTRLLREAQAMARVQHDGIVTVHEAGEVGGHVYVVMELVDGETLGRWQKDRGWREVLAGYLRAGRGLAAAHAAGLVHRDFKPQNVLVGTDGRVRVTDFGLVAASGSRFDDLGHAETATGDDSGRTPGGGRIPRSDPNSALEVPLTRTGDVMGTPAYMAPEQYRSEPADARADQFSFCIALWEGLYGVRPFEAALPDERRLRVLSGEPDPPPPGRDVPARFEAILRRGLQPDPADRWPDMDALLGALADDPVARRRRHTRTALVLGSVGVLAAGAAVAGMLAFGGDDGPRPCRGLDRELDGVWDPTRRAALEGAFAATGKVHGRPTGARVADLLDARAVRWTAMRIEACEATAVARTQSAELLDRRMACLDRRRAELDATVAVLLDDPAAALPRAIDAVLALPRVDACADATGVLAIAPPPTDPAAQDAIARARVDVERAAALLRAGRYKDAKVPAAAAVAAARKVAWAPLLAEALAVEAKARLTTGDTAGAQPELHEAIAAATAAGDSALVARLTVTLVEVAYREARYDDVITLANLADATLGTADDRWDERASLETERGRAAVARRKLDDARAHYQRALALRRDHTGDQSLPTARSLQDLATLEIAAARWPAAEELLRQSLAIREREAGPDHPDVASTLGNLAIVAKEQERFDEGAAFLRRSIAILTAAEGEASPRLAAAHANLGVILGYQGKHADALAALQQALAVRERVLPPDHPDLASSIMNIGIALQENLARPGDAVPYFVRARDLLAKKLGPDHPTLAFALHGLGSARLDLADATAAVPELEQAYRIRSLPDNDPQLRADSGYMLAQALWATGKPAARARARTLAAEAAAIYRDLDDEAGAKVIDAWIASRR